MRLDGGEAKRITDAREGVSRFSFSKDGRWIAYASGRASDEQIYTLGVADLWIPDRDLLAVTQLTRHATGVGAWQWSRDGKAIYFVTPDSIDREERTRTDKLFTVKPRNPASSVSSLWMFDVATRQEKRLTHDSTYSVGDVVASADGKWLGYHSLGEPLRARQSRVRRDRRAAIGWRGTKSLIASACHPELRSE